MSYRKELGQRGEEFVAQHLESTGCEILDRNWRVREGELDLVAQTNQGVFLFVEVKTRTSRKYGDPLEAIDAKKAQRLQKLALAWLMTHDAWGEPFRIDCAGVIFDNAEQKFVLDYRVGVL